MSIISVSIRSGT